jgi:hypothetical protein
MEAPPAHRRARSRVRESCRGNIGAIAGPKSRKERAMAHRLALATALIAAASLGATPGLAQDAGGSRTEVRTLSSGGAPDTRVVTTREERPGRTVERTVVEGPGVDGDATVLSETVEETLAPGARTVERTRQEYAVGPDGTRRLVATVAERTEARADGGRLTVRDYTEPDLNGRTRTTRQEREETVARGDGAYRTRIDIAEPSSRGLVQTRRIERVEQRDGDELVARDSTTYADPTGRGELEAVERRVLTRERAAGSTRSVEVVYRADDNGTLVERERVERRERPRPGGGQIESEEIFTPDINGPGGSRRLERQVASVRTERPGGGGTTTRTVSEARNGRMQVVERVVERMARDATGDVVIERETRRVDVNGRFRTVSTTRARESGQ